VRQRGFAPIGARFGNPFAVGGPRSLTPSFIPLFLPEPRQSVSVFSLTLSRFPIEGPVIRVVQLTWTLFPAFIRRSVDPRTRPLLVDLGDKNSSSLSDAGRLPPVFLFPLTFSPGLSGWKALHTRI